MGSSYTPPGGGIGGTTGNIDNAAIRADGTDGTKAQGSSVIIDDAGSVTGLTAIASGGANLTLSHDSGLAIIVNEAGTIRCYLGYQGGSYLRGVVRLGDNDASVVSDAANTLALRNGANAQAYRVYNTFTDSSNGEWGEYSWNSNVLEIGPKANGTGVVRLIRLLGIPTSDPHVLGTLWSNLGILTISAG